MCLDKQILEIRKHNKFPRTEHPSSLVTRVAEITFSILRRIRENAKQTFSIKKLDSQSSTLFFYHEKGASASQVQHLTVCSREDKMTKLFSQSPIIQQKCNIKDVKDGSLSQNCQSFNSYLVLQDSKNAKQKEKKDDFFSNCLNCRHIFLKSHPPCIPTLTNLEDI